MFSREQWSCCFRGASQNSLARVEPKCLIRRADVSHRLLDSVLVPRGTVGEPERGYPRMPVVRRVNHRIVGPRIPERTVVSRIDRHLAVVSELHVVALDIVAVD